MGTQALDFVSRFHADLAFFSCRGVSPEIGVTEANEDEAALKRIYARNARHVVLMVDSSKLGQQYFCRITDLSAVWRLVTDGELPPEYGGIGAPL